MLIQARYVCIRMAVCGEWRFNRIVCAVAEKKASRKEGKKYNKAMCGITTKRPFHILQIIYRLIDQLNMYVHQDSALVLSFFF